MINTPEAMPEAGSAGLKDLFRVRIEPYNRTYEEPLTNEKWSSREDFKIAPPSRFGAQTSPAMRTPRCLFTPTTSALLR